MPLFFFLKLIIPTKNTVLLYQLTFKPKKT